MADVLASLWSARIRVFVFGVLAALIAFFATLGVTPRYRAEMIVAPADGYALGDYASSVAEGRGLTLPFWRPQEADGVSTDFHRFVFTLRGPAAAAILMKDPVILSGIAQDGRWSHKATDWTAEELAGYMAARVRIQHLGATPLRKIVYDHPDPKFAATFLRKMHLVADQLIRRDRRRNAESRISYLTETLQKTLNPDHKRGIASLLMQQEHIQMLANLDEPYAAIIVEPPATGPRPVWPDRAMIVLAATLLGGGIGYLLHYRRPVRPA